MKSNSIVAATRQSATILKTSHRRFPKRRYAGLATLAFCLLISGFCLRAWGQSYSIDWYKISGGGGTSIGGVYSVSGTIGQPDASGALSGGSYSVTGGFWSLIAVVQTAGAPTLKIAINSELSTITISWPSASSGFVLQQNDNLATGSWTPANSFTVSDDGTTKSITITSPTGNLFFRLSHP